MKDNKTLETFIRSQAIVMNVSLSSLHYQGCGIAARRLLSKNMESRFKLQTSYNLATQVVLVLKQIDSSIGSVEATAAAKAVFDKLTTTLSSAVTSGSFAQVMKTTATALGATNSSNFKVTNAITSGYQATVFTYAPTKSPSLKPTTDSMLIPMPTSESVSSKPTISPTLNTKLDGGALAGIVIGSIVIAALLAYGIYYYLKKSKGENISAKIYVENFDSNKNNDQDVEA